MSKKVYIKLKQQYNTRRESVLLGDVCDIIAYDEKLSVKLRNYEIYNYNDSIEVINSKRTYTAVVSVFQIIKAIKDECGDEVDVVNIGGTDTVVEYKKYSRTNRVFAYFKCAVACVLIFFGSAFTIMAFNNDISISGVFEQFYYQMLGMEKPSFSELEIMYSIGLALGIIVFFNHFGNKKLSDDVTPIEVELNKHKKDTLDTIVELKGDKEE